MKLAVHVHVFYKNLWPELKSYLGNVTVPYDLYVTLVEDDKNLISDIKNFNKKTKVWVVENRGYDIGPFVDFLNKTDLDKYDYILKLHTKGHTGKNTFKDFFKEKLIYWGHKDLWNNLLIKSLLGSKTVFEKNLMMLNNNKKLGMIGSKYLVNKVTKTYKELFPIIPNINYSGKLKFIAGTMFIVKSNLLKPLKGNIKISDFEKTDAKVKDKTFAHIVERLLGGVVIAQGYKIKGFDNSWAMNIIQPIHSIIRFCFDFTKTCQGYYKIKIFRIQVFKMKARS
ncbi:MAG: hypothetical protein IJ638_00025 [Alphaproteobacteria bacterium]|nr:hypothetical protein [Alphaproteobacteria bacterium]